MSDLSKYNLESYIKDRDYNFIINIKESNEDEVDYFLFVEADSIADKSKVPDVTSYYQLMRIKNQIKKSLGYKIKWIVKKGSTSDSLRKAIEDVINKKCHGSIKHVAISPIRYQPLWIYIEKNEESKQVLSKKDILNDLKPFFDLYDIRDAKITIQNAKESFPENPVILLCIKVNAPIKLKEISQILIDKGYDGATEDRLKPKIETLRKYGLIIWSKNDIYSLSLNAQNSFSYVNPKKSPDVLRALELGKRKWHN